MAARPVRGASFAAAALILLSAATDARPAMRPRVPLDIAVEDESDPWSRRDGTGYANDLVRAAFAAEGVDVRLHVVPYARCKRLVVSGAVPACFGMSPEPDLDRSVILAEPPLLTFESEFFERRARPLGARSMRDLRRGTVVGIVLGYEYPPTIDSLVRSATIRVEATTSETINLRKLAAGRLDAALVNHDAIKSPDYVAANAGVTGAVQPAFRAGSLHMYIGFSRRHPNAQWAYERFSAGMRRITSNGELTRIHARWVRRLAREAPR